MVSRFAAAAPHTVERGTVLLHERVRPRDAGQVEVETRATETHEAVAVAVDVAQVGDGTEWGLGTARDLDEDLGRSGDRARDLLELVAADVAEDAAEPPAVKEPGRPLGQADAMWPEADRLDDAPDGAGLHELAGLLRGAVLEALAEHHRVDALRFGLHATHVGQLLQGVDSAKTQVVGGDIRDHCDIVAVIAQALTQDSAARCFQYGGVDFRMAGQGLSGSTRVRPKWRLGSWPVRTR